jgi:hypothetical protein
LTPGGISDRFYLLALQSRRHRRFGGNSVMRRLYGMNQFLRLIVATGVCALLALAQSASALSRRHMVAPNPSSILTQVGIDGHVGPARTLTIHQKDVVTVRLTVQLSTGGVAAVHFTDKNGASIGEVGQEALTTPADTLIVSGSSLLQLGGASSSCTLQSSDGETFNFSVVPGSVTIQSSGRAVSTGEQSPELIFSQGILLPKQSVPYVITFKADIS